MTLLNLIQNRGLTSEGSKGNKQPSHTSLLLTEYDFVLNRLIFSGCEEKAATVKDFPLKGCSVDAMTTVLVTAGHLAASHSNPQSDSDHDDGRKQVLS